MTQPFWPLVRLLAIFGLCFAVAACDFTDDTPTYRYRLKVEVETPEGLKTGSSVIEVETNVTGEYSIPTPGAVRTRARGEAVAVDLAERGVLFALLRSESEVDWASKVMYLLGPPAPGGDAEAFKIAFRDMLSNRREIEVPRFFRPAGHLRRRPARPMLVTFNDLSDPTTVERVDQDDLAATFGEGVELKRITVQLTEEPVTTGIEKKLAWFRELAQSGGGLVPMVENERGRYEVAEGYDASLAEIGLSNFSTEAYEQ